jgi:outer membrane protein assembly factor BamB
LPQSFTVIGAAPVITSVLPNSAGNGGPVSVTLNGSNFLSGAVVRLTKVGESDIVAVNVVAQSPERISCVLDVTGRAVGFWSVSVKNTDLQSATLLDAFKLQGLGVAMVGPVSVAPGPFNPLVGVAKIKYFLTRDSDIIIYVYNIRGERIWQAELPAGQGGGRVGANEVVWSGVTTFKEMVGSGVYIVQIKSRTDQGTKTIGTAKIMVIK